MKNVEIKSRKLQTFIKTGHGDLQLRMYRQIGTKSQELSVLLAATLISVAPTIFLALLSLFMLCVGGGVHWWRPSSFADADTGVIKV